MQTFARAFVVLLIASLSAAAQTKATDLQAIENAERARRLALTGDLGLPALKPVKSDSPRDTMYFADRVLVPQDQPPPPDVPPGTMFNGNIPAGAGGTGTDKPEIFKYQVPWNYDANGPKVPLVICYHGYGLSANSVALQSTLDEEANLRGWMYMAPTGIDDQLFGSPISQQNTSAAFQWMLDNFNIDKDRCYMVGFSMGGGVVLNYVARHRDPNGLMIAAAGVVSGTMDWTLEYATNSGLIQTLLENPYNFGGTPAQFPFAYQQASSLYFQPGTYPPLPGLLDITHSMAQNLGATPFYVTWDLHDTIPAVLAEEPVLLAVLSGLGGTVEAHPVTGTPTPHSWGVLDEAALFDFFQTKTANRSPASIEALADRDERIGWTQVQQFVPLGFSHVSAVAMPAQRTLSASSLDNIKILGLHADGAGLAGTALVHAAATNSGGADATLELQGDQTPAGWLQSPTDGSLILGTHSDPAGYGLYTPLPSGSSVAVDLAPDADYVAQLSTTPQPAAVGGPVTLNLDGPDNATQAFLLLGLVEGKGFFKGGHVALVQLGLASTVVVPLPLLPGGQIQATGSVPNSPSLHGITFLMQAILAGGPAFNSISNLWLMDIS